MRGPSARTLGQFEKWWSRRSKYALVPLPEKDVHTSSTIPVTHVISYLGKRGRQLLAQRRIFHHLA